MQVYYGWSRLNAVTKREGIAVIFMNVDYTPPRLNKDGHNGVTARMHLCYERKQTTKEAEDAKTKNRIYTAYYIFMDQHKNSLEKVLTTNYLADENNVSKAERERIREALRVDFMNRHPDYKEPDNMQLEIQFE